MWLDILKGAGAILGAGATMYTGKQQNKIEREKLNYQKSQDASDRQKNDLAQSNLDSAIESVYGKEKKKKDPNAIGTDLSMAYGTPTLES